MFKSKKLLDQFGSIRIFRFVSARVVRSSLNARESLVETGLRLRLSIAKSLSTIFVLLRLLTISENIFIVFRRSYI